MRKSHFHILTWLGVMALFSAVLSGCKPTEKNYADAYTKAYEAAQRKAEAERTGEDGVILEPMDSPNIQAFGTDTVAVGTGRLKPFEYEGEPAMHNYGIAVAKYSMPTNARNHLQTVRTEYPDAFMATDGQQGYYVMIERIPSVSDAADPIRVYIQGHPNDKYMGLDGHPVVYFISPK